MSRVERLNARRCPRRPPTTVERAEFARLVEVAGILHRPDLQADQAVRCLDPDAHAHGDRRRSATLNLGKCLVYCHACARWWGLAALRDLIGFHPTRPNPESHRLTVGETLDGLARLTEEDVELHRWIPPVLLDCARRQTGRYKDLRALDIQLRRMLAICLDVARESGHLSGVTLTQADAVARGLHARHFGPLMPMMAALGFGFTVGESGRRPALVAHRTRNGQALAASTFTIDRRLALPLVANYSSACSSGTTGVMPLRDPLSRLRTAVSAIGTNDRDSPLRHRPARCRLVADLADMPLGLDDFGSLYRRGHTARTLSLVVADGLVSVVDGIAYITPVGRAQLDADAAAGLSRRAEVFAATRARWADAQQTIAAKVIRLDAYDPARRVDNASSAQPDAAEWASLAALVDAEAVA